MNKQFLIIEMQNKRNTEVSQLASNGFWRGTQVFCYLYGFFFRSLITESKQKIYFSSENKTPAANDTGLIEETDLGPASHTLATVWLLWGVGWGWGGSLGGAQGVVSGSPPSCWPTQDVFKRN